MPYPLGCLTKVGLLLTNGRLLPFEGCMVGFFFARFLLSTTSVNTLLLGKG
jgi:hypothetical protein